MIPHSEPHHFSANPIAPDYNGGAPEVPPELGRLLQQLFDALEDYMNASFEAMANVAPRCKQAVSKIGQTLQCAYWSQDDILLLLHECISRIKTDQHLPGVEARAALLMAHFPGWIAER